MKNISKLVLIVVILSAAFQAFGAVKFKNAGKESKYLKFMKICAEGSDNEIIKALKSGNSPNVTD